MWPLKHPIHGKKIAYWEEEANMDRKNGWVDDIPEKKKRGRKPRLENGDK